MRRAFASLEAALSNVITKAERLHGTKYAVALEEASKTLFQMLDSYMDWYEEEVT
jgi:predicted RNA-binding protein with PIN domain